MCQCACHYLNLIRTEEDIGFKIIQGLIDDIKVGIVQCSRTTGFSPYWQNGHVPHHLTCVRKLGVVRLKSTHKN